ncbi:bifunctional [glutamate--ammonia ligase]-adenylyl-L-tyrosine phosphorylase/[glutamate--ammonia-ligase] adenylyltransferase [Desulfosarcina sp. OttesenSCG-928-A07]|nr:bifunctional [glutamate--ammonia ligase]-adenylyl-L-tyrosine phosphorylase/[glutamate--ammonia-ligase] adenylyltransferase [Desulfosarcina sp. OttesenSCG-928-G17]MDL2328634.1 bifunctional [glutamate--ammonia ligase]-adenylyl-L-tyrosine phosphorylase/[glutamate--ammonia-ligase] adenylyltransferase [Desulfosarcina sp. OttesenSCG-928-A07]
MTVSLHAQLQSRKNERWAALCAEMENCGHTLSSEADGVRALRQAVGFSEFVFSTCLCHPQMTADLLDSADLFRSCTPDETHHEVTRQVEAATYEIPPGSSDAVMPPLKTALRVFRRREMVRIAVRDLSGISTLDETMADISALAEAAVNSAVNLLYTHLCQALGVPKDENGRDQRLVVLGMGKLGAAELNFSSDIDLIFAFPADGKTHGRTRSVSNDVFFTRLCRLLIQAIGEVTVDGFVFRVDTRLRPYGDGGPIVMSFDHMEDYYHTQGREWERYALIKAHVIAGDPVDGDVLLSHLGSFVFRRYLDFGAFESLREMKANITAEVRRKKLDTNIKLGSGGIREIEFFGQIFQLIRGGIFPALRHPAIQTILEVLAHEDIIPMAVCRELTDAYRFLRNIENRLQEENDQQTHALPGDPLSRLALSRSMGFSSWDAFYGVLEHHRHKVRTHFAGLLESDAEATHGKTPLPSLDIRFVDAWTLSLTPDECRQLLEKGGMPDSGAISESLTAFKSEPGIRTLTETGKRRLDRLMPRILDMLSGHHHPGVILDRVLNLFRQIQQRISYFSLLTEYPVVLDHLIRLMAASPWIADFLGRHPVLLDELLNTGSLYTPPTAEALRKELVRQLAMTPDDDPEYKMDVLRVFHQVNVLRIAASDITSVLPLMKVSDHLTWVAEVILEAVVNLCWDDLVAKHGRPACTLSPNVCDRGFAVIGYGKLGGYELGYRSDLDLVFLHAADGGETLGGAHPIDNAHFFSRLGQRVVHMLSAHTAAGTLYDIDMRLRPNGSAGLLVSHVKSFASYQKEKAWTWEHQALIRARPITGDPMLLDAFSKIRQEVLCMRRNPDTLQADVRDMRERMHKNRPPSAPGRFDIKEDPGALVDIEFLVQYLVLRYAAEHPSITRWTDNVRLLRELAESGILEDQIAHALRQCYLIYRSAIHRLNLADRSTQINAHRFRRLRTFVRNLWKKLLES